MSSHEEHASACLGAVGVVTHVAALGGSFAGETVALQEALVALARERGEWAPGAGRLDEQLQGASVVAQALPVTPCDGIAKQDAVFASKNVAAKNAF